MALLRVAAEYLEEGLVLGRRVAWAYFRLPTVSYGFLSEGERQALLVDAAAALTGLGDAECHLLTVPRPRPVEAWLRELHHGAPGPAPGWGDYLERVRRHLGVEAFWSKEVFLGIRLGTRGACRGRPPRWRRGRPRPARVGEGELERWRARVGALGGFLAGGALRGEPAAVDDLRWLIERAFWRGIGEPPRRVPTGPWRGDALAALASAELHNSRHALRVRQGEATGQVAFLAACRFPPRLPFPGGEWLHHADTLPFPVETSLRFRVVPARQASADAGRKLAQASDQVRHIVGTSSEPPLALLAAAEQARRLEYELVRDGAPLIYGWPRFALAAPTRPELETRIEALLHAYRDLGIDLVRPSGDQLSLFLESLPGDRVRVRTYQQRQGVVTVAGSLFQAGPDLGDGVGPYIGVTTTAAPCPVRFDPLEAAQRNLPTAVTVTGQPGAGKTNLAGLLTYQLALRGARCLLVDPKNEATGLTRLPGLEAVRCLRIGTEDAGFLDPYALAGNPRAGALLAVDVIRLLLPAAAGDHETALVAACQDEAETARPCLLGAADRLLDVPEPEVRRLARTLRLYADFPLARLFFPAGPGPARLREQLTVLQIQGLSVPDAGVPRAERTLADRLAVAVLFLLVRLAQRLVDESRAPARAIVLDEAWTLTSTRQGRALVERLARTGRSRNTAVVLVTQSAADLLDETVTNNVSARFAFRSTHPEEVEAVLGLLGVDPSPEHVATLRGLGTGECLLADVDGRVGSVQVDLVLPELRAALDTTPRRLAEVGG